MASEEEAMAYSRGAVERAMKVQEVILRAIDGKLTWVQAADILGYSPRTIRRIRWRLQHYGYDGLLDRRRQTPSPKRAPVAEVQRLLALYREHYLGFNVRHFHQLARREHGVRFCYARSEEHTSELQSQSNLVCRLLLEKKKTTAEQTLGAEPVC